MGKVAHFMLHVILLSFPLEKSGTGITDESLRHEEAEQLNNENGCPNTLLDPNSNNNYTMQFFPGVEHPCCPCNPGYRREGSCQKRAPSTTICVPCEKGTFMEEFAHGHVSCKKENITCQDNQILIPSTATTKPYCLCIDGFKTDDEDVCQPHAKCPSGFGVDVEGTQTRNTKCEECKPGFEAPEFSSITRCKPTASVMTNERNKHLHLTNNNASVGRNPGSVNTRKLSKTDSSLSGIPFLQTTTSVTVSTTADSFKECPSLGMQLLTLLPMIAILLVVVLFILRCVKQGKKSDAENVPTKENEKGLLRSNRDEIGESNQEGRDENDDNNHNNSSSSFRIAVDTEGEESTAEVSLEEANDRLLNHSASSVDTSTNVTCNHSLPKKMQTTKSFMTWSKKRKQKEKSCGSKSNFSANSTSPSDSFECRHPSKNVASTIETHSYTGGDGEALPLKTVPFPTFAPSQTTSNNPTPVVPTFNLTEHRTCLMSRLRMRLCKELDRDQAKEFYRDIRNDPTSRQVLEDLDRAYHTSTSEMFNKAFEKLTDLGWNSFNPQVIKDHFEGKHNRRCAEYVESFLDEWNNLDNQNEWAEDTV